MASFLVIAACGDPVATGPDSTTPNDANVVDNTVVGNDSSTGDTGIDVSIPDSTVGPDTSTGNDGAPDGQPPADTSSDGPTCTVCESGCVDLQTDNNNCGRCGTSCAANERCSTGMCKPECQSPNRECGMAPNTTCVAVQTDPLNCGSCGNACMPNEMCMNGTCTSSCPSPRMMCGTGGMSSCVDLQTDSANCGSCGRMCMSNERCVGGNCILQCTTMGEEACGAAGAMTCVNTQTSNANCGRCGNACSSTETCIRGVCRANCASNEDRCGDACVDLNASDENCGRCGNVCPGGQSCLGGVCRLICTNPQQVCGAGAAQLCVNTNQDPSNCGSCGNACPSGQVCLSGSCTLVCTGGLTLCGSGANQTCVDLQTNNSFCGNCTTACPNGQSCVTGRCMIGCMAPSRICTNGTTQICTNTDTDTNNCGSCGMTCSAGQVCRAGLCLYPAPANDTSNGAITISLSQPTQTITATTLGANTDASIPTTCGASICAPSGMGNPTPDVYYTFTLQQREIVYADTFGANYDTVLQLQNAAGQNITPPTISDITCSNDSCTSRQSQIAAVLPAGVYFLVVSGCAGTSGVTPVRFQHLPAATNVNARRSLTTPQFDITGTLPANGRSNTSACSGAGTEDMYWFLTCPNDPARLLHATTCNAGTAFDSVLYERTPGRMPDTVCNDDASFACTNRSSITSSIPAGAGVHAMYVDAFSGVVGAYTVNVRVDSCNTGFTNCSNVCLQTTQFQTDNLNCGGCGNRCSSAQSCVAGACRPLNDTCAAAQTVTLLSSGQTTVVRGNTAGATSEAMECSGIRPSPTVWLAITLPARSLVYVDGFGSTIDTLIGFRDACGSTTTSCNDDSNCAGTGNALASQAVAVLEAGTRFIEVGSPLGATGSYQVNIQHIPVATFSSSSGTVPQGLFSVMGTTNAFFNFAFAPPGTCGGAATPTRYYHWTTCPLSGGGSFQASTCNTMRGMDTVLELLNGNGMNNACNNNGTNATCGGLGSELSSTLSNGAGLHMVLVRALGGSTPASGTYQIIGSRP